MLKDKASIDDVWVFGDAWSLQSEVLLENWGILKTQAKGETRSKNAWVGYYITQECHSRGAVYWPYDIYEL